jgi:hypothetical protein
MWLRNPEAAQPAARTPRLGETSPKPAFPAQRCARDADHRMFLVL